MNALNKTKEENLNKIIYVIKLSSAFFSVLALFQYYLPNKTLFLGIKDVIIFSFITLILLLFYLSWNYLSTLKYVYFIVTYVEPFINLSISFLAIMLTGTFDSNFKFLFVFVIISTTIDCGMKNGLIVASISSIMILSIDLIFSPHNSVKLYFQDDLVLVSTFIIIAWTVGFYVKTENEYTVLKAQEQIMLEKNRSLENEMIMKDEFLSMISHELRTPLTVINAAISIMELNASKKNYEKAFEYTINIKRNTFRQIRLVNNLLDLTRANAEKLKLNLTNQDIIFLTQSIIDSISEYLKLKNITLYFNSFASEHVICVDEEKYERILLNLLSNAIKFTPSGNSIILNIFLQDDFINIEVMDEGIGIPDNKKAIIFDRFGQVDSSSSRQAEGTGIGLCLVKKMAEALGGSISVESKVGKGSTFTVRIPNIKVQEENTQTNLYEISDTQLIQAVAIEFSDIY
jgi:signal transduction histidine kinase